MTVEEIKELIQVVNESGIAELEVQRGENRVRIRRSNGPVMQDYILPPAMSVSVPVPSPAAAQPPAPAPTAPSGAASVEPAADQTAVYVKSPIVGTFYESASPGSPPFVKVGDKIQPGQILCIIESMKLMNEIEAEIAGTLVGKLVENGRPVEYGEALFAVQPA
jgi:acetyl-CoA carboxylase biotin carboxyl carrier protein